MIQVAEDRRVLVAEVLAMTPEQLELFKQALAKRLSQKDKR